MKISYAVEIFFRLAINKDIIIIIKGDIK